MVDIGQGHCDDGYYAGWDGNGDESVEACKQYCLKDRLCKYVSYINDGTSKSCSRYSGNTCTLQALNELQRKHESFKKGLSST